MTVYNTEQQSGEDTQSTTVSVTGGAVSGELGAIVSVVAKDSNTVTTEQGKQTASKSQTTLTVSGSVAPASINTSGKTTYYTNVSDAVGSVGETPAEATQITVFGNAALSTDVALKDNITLVVTPGVTLTADVTSGETGKTVVATTDGNGNTVYKLEEVSSTNEYAAVITDANGDAVALLYHAAAGDSDSAERPDHSAAGQQ